MCNGEQPSRKKASAAASDDARVREGDDAASREHPLSVLQSLGFNELDCLYFNRTFRDSLGYAERCCKLSNYRCCKFSNR